MDARADGDAPRAINTIINGVERLFVVTTIVVSIAFWLWFAFKAGSPLPNQ